MAKRKDKPTPINREKFLNNLHDPYQIPEQVEQPYDNSNPDAKYRKPGEPEFLRANEISMKGDTNNVINITLEDHDEAILYYIKNIIKPTVEINGNQQEVPVIYGSPERWKSMQKDGFFRDKNGKAFIPVIAVKRESFEKDRRLGNKLDGNKVQNVQYFKTGYSKRNGYDNFSVLQNQKPAEEYQVGVIPDYITVTYKLSIFTDYVEHMNSIIEAIEFASDSYWGDKERFNFRASITQFPTPTEVVNGNDRAVKSDLTLNINGYIIPKSINVQKAAPSPKSYNVTKFVFKEFAQESTTSQIDKDGNKVITYTNPSQNNVSYFGTFNGNFIGDGSGLINLPNQNIDTGSLVTTSSFNNFTSSYNQDSASFDSRINNINFDTGSLVTTSSFNEFISNYNTGSFVGLFEGNLIGTSSYSQNSLSSSYYDEQDPIFQASEASLFISGDKANLDNQSGVNTGDETQSSIKTKLGQANASADGYLSSTDWSIFNNKQDNIGYTPANKAGETFTGPISATNLSGTNTGDNAPNSNYASDYRASNFIADTDYLTPNTANSLFDFKPVIYQKHTNIPIFGSAAINNVEGVGIIASGAQGVRSWADTNLVTRGQRLGIVVSLTGGLSQLRQTLNYMSINGGFDMITAFSMSENATDTAIRFFIGLTTNNIFTNVEPNTLLNIIGICRLSSSDNLHLINNDNTGTATTIDLGSNFPANTIDTDKYQLNIKTISGGIYLKLDRLGTSFYYETIITSDIPSNSTGLRFGAYIVDTSGPNVSTGFDWYGTHIKI